MTFKANGKEVQTLHIDGTKFVQAHDSMTGKIIKCETSLYDIPSANSTDKYKGRMEVIATVDQWTAADKLKKHLVYIVKPLDGDPVISFDKDVTVIKNSLFVIWEYNLSNTPIYVVG